MRKLLPFRGREEVSEQEGRYILKEKEFTGDRRILDNLTISLKSGAEEFETWNLHDLQYRYPFIHYKKEGGKWLVVEEPWSPEDEEWAEEDEEDLF